MTCNSAKVIALEIVDEWAARTKHSLGGPGYSYVVVARSEHANGPSGYCFNTRAAADKFARTFNGGRCNVFALVESGTVDISP